LKEYIVTLTDEERRGLSAVIAAGKAAAQKLAHARILLKADASVGGPARPDQRFVEQGLDAALVRKAQERPSRLPTLDGRAEARIIALACSAPPEGRATWTMQLLADKLVELEVVPTVSDETVRRALKKTS
jgi:hypothetical protein